MREKLWNKTNCTASKPSSTQKTSKQDGSLGEGHSYRIKLGTGEGKSAGTQETEGENPQRMSSRNLHLYSGCLMAEKSRVDYILSNY
jgi:hypothetical protein